MDSSLRRKPTRGVIILDGGTDYSEASIQQQLLQVIESNEKRQSTDPKDLLSRQSSYVLPISLIVYAVLQVGIHWTGICSGKVRFSRWVDWVHLVCSVGFVLASLLNTFRIISERGTDAEAVQQRSIYAATLAVNLMSASGTLLTVFGGVDRFGCGICTDSLGTETVSAQWGEWVASVPLLVYITIAMEEKSALEEEDWTILLAICTAMVLGFLLQLQPRHDVGVALLVCAMTSLSFILLLIFRSSAKARKAIDDIGKKYHSENQLKTIRQSFVKKYLSRLICLNFPFFPVIYFLRLVGILDRDQLAAGFAIASIFAKTIFIGSLSKSQMSIHDKLASQLFAEKRANDTRRAFMRYVFHEVRVPLNTITMGLSLLKDDMDSRLSSSAREAIAMMTGATDFMSDTLNDVLSIHKIEEGAMELMQQPFKMRDLLQRVVVTIKGQCDVKQIKVVIESPDDSAHSLPYLIGDRFRLEHVVINFLSNAVKFSTPGSKVKIIVKCSEEMAEVPASTRNIASAAGRDYSFRHDSDPPPTVMTSRNISLSVPVERRKSSGKRRTVTYGDRLKSGSHSPSPPSSSASSVADHSPQSDTVPHYREVSIVVMDQGVGISKEGLAKLFVPFSQISPETLQQGQGSGLGLVLAKEIINLHGGVVLCDSVQGNGSSFGFRIPFEVVDGNSTFKIIEDGIQVVRSKFATPSGSRLNTPGASTVGSPHHSSMCTPLHSHRGSPLHSRPGSPAMGLAPQALLNLIPQRPTLALLVDDTPSNSKMLSMLLRKRGVVPSEPAENGEIAVNVMKNAKDHYDIIFMDYSMPVMNGLEATMLIRELGYKGLMIGLTGNAMDDDVIDFLNSGVDSVISKPLKSTELDAILRYGKEHDFRGVEPGRKLALRRGGAAGGDELIEIEAVPPRRDSY